MAGLNVREMTKMTEQINKDRAVEMKVMGPLFEKYRRYFAKKDAREARERAEREALGIEEDDRFDITEWSSKPSRMSLVWVGLNPDPMKSKLMRQWSGAALPPPQATPPGTPAEDEPELHLPDWVDPKRSDELDLEVEGPLSEGPSRPARPMSAKPPSGAGSAASLRQRPKSASAASASRVLNAKQADAVSSASGSTASGPVSSVGSYSSYKPPSAVSEITPSDSASQYGSEEAATEKRSGSGGTLASSYYSASGGPTAADAEILQPPDPVIPAAKPRPRSAMSGSNRSAGSSARSARPQSAHPTAARASSVPSLPDWSQAPGANAVRSSAPGTPAALGETRTEYQRTPTPARPGTRSRSAARSSASPAAGPRLQRAKSASTIGSRPRPKKKVSAAVNFLTQTLSMEKNPHHDLIYMALPGNRWGYPINESVSKESLKEMVKWGFSHEGEGRAGYLRAMYQKAPQERLVMPCTTNQMIGFQVPIGKAMKLYPAKDQKPGVKQFFSTTHNTGLRRPEIANLADDAVYPGDGL